MGEQSKISKIIGTGCAVVALFVIVGFQAAIAWTWWREVWQWVKGVWPF